MAVSLARRKMSQLTMFARPQCHPHWAALSPDVQRKIVRLMAQLLRRHRETAMEAGMAEEAHDE
jgi:acyl-CoA reductase-like NAD-dependent aldehyde dehydrogenase